jgi:hypothetical protein
MIDRKGKPEALILANGPSLDNRAWSEVPRDRVFVLGVNQSWRLYPRPDAHLAPDVTQYNLPGAKDFYTEYAKAGGVTLHGDGFRYGRVLDVFQGPWVRDVKDRVSTGQLGKGCVTFCALQLVQHCERIWVVGLDLTDKKFTGEPSNSEWQDQIFATVPEDVRDKVRVISPSRTKVFRVVGWPWGGKGRRAA